MNPHAETSTHRELLHVEETPQTSPRTSLMGLLIAFSALAGGTQAATPAWAGSPLICEHHAGEVADLPRDFWGMSANQVLPGGNTLSNHQQLAPRIRQALVSNVRVQDLVWRNVQPTEGVPPNWSDLADIYQAYKDSGLKVTVAIRGTPDWAAVDQTCVPDCIAEPPDLQAWEEFVTDAATTFAGIVNAWQIWNEPNSINAFVGTPSEYVAMLNRAHNAIKAVDPSAEVWAPNTISLCSPDPRPFETEVASSGLFDTFATHIYCFEGLAQKITTFDEVRAILDTNGHATTPLYITETNNRVVECGIDPDLQAEFLEELYSCFAVAGVDSVFWWKATDTCTCPAALIELGNGLVWRPDEPEGGVDCPDPDDVRDNGIITTQYDPKPAHARYRELVKRASLFVDGFESGDTSAWSQVEQ